MTQITQFLRRAAQTNGGGLASVDGDRRQDWAGFADRAARLAGGLAGQGCSAGDRIGILALNCDRYLECFFGLAWGGFIFVPINTRLAVPEIIYWLTDSGCTGLFIDDAFLPVLPALCEAVSGLRVVHIGEGPTPAGLLRHDAVIAAAAAAADAGRGGDDLAGIFYTGGTTGRSKGVMLSHENLVSNALNVLAEVPLNPRSRYCHAAPMFHLADGAMTFTLTAVGGTHFFLPRFDPVGLLKLVAAQRITNLLIVPTMINMLVHHPEIGAHDISSLHTVLYGASPMPEAVIRRATAVMPGTKFIQAYGQSEAAPVMTLMSADAFDLAAGHDVHRLKSAGRGVMTCEERILDEDDNEVPHGTVGEICGRGPMVMLGYWKQPELTAHTLRNGWLHTGDGGTMDTDGYVYIVDRLKDMIITGGENVYSAEVEEALYSHAAVAECAVIGVPDAQWGERVHAIVRCKPDMAADEEGLIVHCRTRIANYKLPRSVSFSAEPLPLSGAGKILKSELRKPYWEGQDRRVS